MALASGIGAEVHLEQYPGSTAAMLFGEDQAVYLITSKRGATDLIERLNEHGVVGEQIGVTGGDALTIGDYNQQSSLSLADLRAAHEGFFPRLMGSELTPEF